MKVGAQDDVGHRVSHRLDAAQRDAHARAAHAVQHGVGAVLERHVEVRHDVGESRHGLRQPRGNAPGVGVHHPYPRHVRDGGGQLLQQPRQAVTRSAVFAEGRGVLRHQHQLAHAAPGVPARLRDQARSLVGVHAALYGGDDAERAGAVAAVGDLQVGAWAAAARDRREVCVRNVEGGVRRSELRGGRRPTPQRRTWRRLQERHRAPRLPRSASDNQRRRAAGPAGVRRRGREWSRLIHPLPRR